MKQLTTTKATYMNVTISVLSERLDDKTMFCCGNSLTGPHTEDKWFATQGEAIANERHAIDRKMGIAPRVEVQRSRWGR